MSIDAPDLKQSVLEPLASFIEASEAALLYGSAAYLPLELCRDIDILNVSDALPNAKLVKQWNKLPVHEYALTWDFIQADAVELSCGGLHACAFWGPFGWIRYNSKLGELMWTSRSVKLSNAAAWLWGLGESVVTSEQVACAFMTIEVLYRPHFVPAVTRWRKHLKQGNPIVMNWWNSMLDVAESVLLKRTDPQSINALWSSEYTQAVRFWWRYFQTHDNSVEQAVAHVRKGKVDDSLFNCLFGDAVSSPNGMPKGVAERFRKWWDT